MDKRKKRKIIICVIIIAIILLFPFNIYGINDGGSYGYGGILYEIIVWRPMEDGDRGISINIFRLFSLYIEQ